MVPVWIALLFLSFVSLFLAIDLPRQKIQYDMVKTAHDVTSFWAYRKGIIDYLDANPGITGHVNEALVAAYWPRGYTYDPTLWSNYVDPADQKLYIFSLSPPNNGMLSALANRYTASFFVGTKNSAGNFVSFNGKVNFALPVAASIGSGVVVMIGR